MLLVKQILTQPETPIRLTSYQFSGFLFLSWVPFVTVPLDGVVFSLMRFLPFGISIPCGSGELEVDGGTLELPEAFGLGVPAVGEVGVEEGEAEALCKPGVGLEIAAGPAFGAVLVWHPVMKMTIAIVAK